MYHASERLNDPRFYSPIATFKEWDTYKIVSPTTIRSLTLSDSMKVGFIN